MVDNHSTTHPKIRILFVCTGNTCRSVMAEAIARRRFGEAVEVSSAGLRPQVPEDAENAIYTLHSLLGIDASGHKPRDIRDCDLRSFDYVVAMDNHVSRDLKQHFENLPASKLITWDIHDPWGNDLEEYRKSAQSVVRAVAGLPVGKKT